MKEIAKDLIQIQAVKLSPNEPLRGQVGSKSPDLTEISALTISYPKIVEQRSPKRIRRIDKL